jgi:hypothetical protein
MGRIGLEVSEINFIAGHMKSVEGNNLWFSAQDKLTSVVSESAPNYLRKTKLGNFLTRTWREDVLSLYLARCYNASAGYTGHHTMLTVLVAEMVARTERKSTTEELSGGQTELIIGLPHWLDRSQLKNHCKSLTIIEYRILDVVEFVSRLVAIIKLSKVIFLNSWVKLSTRWMKIYRETDSNISLGDKTIPALLVMHEDELSVDRTYRTQPHWKTCRSETEEFRTLILEWVYPKPKDDILAVLRDQMVYWVPKENLSHGGANVSSLKIEQTLSFLLRSCLFDWNVSGYFLRKFTALFRTANILAAFCADQRVKAFMTCENYCIESDAMDLFSKESHIKTISYQYSNIASLTIQMATNADVMLTFSPLFHGRWRNDQWGPSCFIDVGYLYDGSFPKIRCRANKLRESIRERGAEFVIAVFDENITANEDKFGFFSVDDYLGEMAVLRKYLAYHKTVGVISKRQFGRAQRLLEVTAPSSAVCNEIGERWIELFEDGATDRNIILPAEAAVAADIAIGHFAGATAGLEAALVGCRCILINPEGVQNDNLELLQQGRIVFADLEDALNAVSSYREGQAEYSNLGDWSKIIASFDSFQDGRAALRCRKFLNEVIL